MMSILSSASTGKDDPVDGKCAYGYLVHWGGPIVVKSGKLNHVGINSTYNEYMALHHAIKQVVWLRQLMAGIPSDDDSSHHALESDSRWDLGGIRDRSLVSYKGLTRPGEGVCCSHRTRSKVGIRFSFDMVRWGGLQQTASALVPN